MRRALGIVLLAPLMLVTMGNRGCEVQTPQQVQATANRQMAEYFPNVHTAVYPEEQKIIALTCLYGASSKVVEKIYGEMLSDQSMQSSLRGLNQLRTISSFTGGHSYRFFILGFEHDLIVYDVDSHQLDYQPVSGPAWEKAYSDGCSDESDPSSWVH
jgi:hypothetical protein